MTKTNHIESAKQQLLEFIHEGCFSIEDIYNKTILDYECGGGHYSHAFLGLGARDVVGIDSWLADSLRVDLDRLKLRRGDIFDLVGESGYKFDFVFLNTVTEHLGNLFDVFASILKLLSRDGIVFVNHDNYYHPSGSHDHGMLGALGDGSIGFLGKKCWKQANCSVSASHRHELITKLPWTWNETIESLLDPSRCDICPYFLRSQPWSHLIYQNNFSRIFPQSFFTNKSLNKISIFQLKQILIECGYKIIYSNRTFVANQVDERLINGEDAFSKVELITWMYRATCVRAS